MMSTVMIERIAETPSTNRQGIISLEIREKYRDELSDHNEIHDGQE